MTDEEKKQSKSISFAVFKNYKITEAVNDEQITQSTG